MISIGLKTVSICILPDACLSFFALAELAILDCHLTTVLVEERSMRFRLENVRIRKKTIVRIRNEKMLQGEKMLR